MVAVVCDLCYQEVKWEMETYLPNKLLSHQRATSVQRPPGPAHPGLWLISLGATWGPCAQQLPVGPAMQWPKTLVTRHPGRLTRSFSFLSCFAPSLCSEPCWPAGRCWPVPPRIANGSHLLQTPSKSSSSL